VGFDIGGFELGLDPDVSGGGAGAGGSVAYWRVANLDTALADFTKNGAGARSPARDVGGGIRVASVNDPFGNVIGLIEDPNYKGAKS
jgi:predicted enzyme related to lactoylglutathione lyase